MSLPHAPSWIAAAVWVACLSSHAQAPDKALPTVDVSAPAQPFRQMLGVEVTGTAIINPKARERLPLTVIERREIERSGFSTVMDLLAALPMASNTVDDGVLGDGGSEAAALGLRGEPGSTLVLLNGVRLPSHSVQTQGDEFASVHLNFIPLSAVERIEILREGASTLYGSDAVAGVVNIITRTDLRTWQAGSRHELLPGGSGNRHSVNLQWGGGDWVKDGYQVLAAAERSVTTMLRAQDRPEAWRPRTFIATDNRAAFVWPANTYDYNQRRYLPNPLYRDGRCQGEHLYAGEEIGRVAGVCYYDRTAIFDIYPAQTLTQLFLQGRVRLGAQHSLYAEHAATQGVRTGSPDINFTSAYSPTTGLGHFMGLMGVQPVLAPRRESFRRSVLALQGQLAERSYKVWLYDGRQTAQTTFSGYLAPVSEGYFSADELATPPDQFSAATWQKIRALQLDLPYQKGFSSERGITGKLSAQLELPNGLDAQYALGAGWRSEGLDFQRDISAVDIRARRQVAFVFGESSYALNEALTLAAGARADRYSDVGQANALKVSARYQPSERWMLRGALGNGFRAPSLALTSSSAPAITTRGSLNGQPVYVFTSGNPGLKPEKSRHLTLGTQWTGGTRWAASVDWWALLSRGLVELPDPNAVLADPALRSRYLSAIDFANTVSDIPRNAIGFYRQPDNLALRDQQGIDYQFQYRKPLDQGVLRLQWSGTWTLRSNYQAQAGGPIASDLGNYLADTGRTIPRHRWALSAALEPSQRQRHLLTLHYQSGNLELAGTPAQAHIPAHWTLDWHSQFSPARGVTLGVGIRNLTNRLPPQRQSIQSNVPGIDTRYGDYRGRTFLLHIDTRF